MLKLQPQSSQTLNHLSLLHFYVFMSSSKQSLLHHKHSSAARIVGREDNVFCASFVLVGEDGLTDDFWYAFGEGETLALSKQ